MKLAVLVLIFAVCPVWGQIVQSHPEYCGIAGGVNPPLPPDISVTIDQSAGHAVLYIDRGGMAKAVPLPDLISEVAEVCPLADGRLVVFADFGGTDVFIVDRVTASVTNGSRPISRKCPPTSDGSFIGSSIRCTEWRPATSY